MFAKFKADTFIFSITWMDGLTERLQNDPVLTLPQKMLDFMWFLKRLSGCCKRFMKRMKSQYPITLSRRDQCF